MRVVPPEAGSWGEYAASKPTLFERKVALASIPRARQMIREVKEHEEGNHGLAGAEM
jgi:hypothetical protein